MRALVNFLFEVGMLKKTPRAGYQFLGSGRESVAGHSFRTAVIGYFLSLQEPKADVHKTTLMCLFHDVHEARTGDLNYVNKQYVEADEERALRDATQKLPHRGEIVSLLREFNEQTSLEACLSRDADQLDLILALKEQEDLGNKYAREWVSYAVQRLTTESAKTLAMEILETDSTEWWFEKKRALWVDGPGDRDDVKGCP
jgi:putative hydrolase of HD superfamily